MSAEREDELDASEGACGGIWNSLLAADDTAVDVESLAAFAEGRLSREEREAVRAQIARSPMALEILDSLCEQTAKAVRCRRGVSADALGSQFADEPPILVGRAASAAYRPPEVPGDSTAESSRTPTTAAAEKRPLPLSIYAAAASLLLAVGVSFLAYEQWLARGDVQAKLASVSKDLVSAYKAKLHGKSNTTSVLVGDLTADDFAALLDGERMRGSAPADPEQEAEVEQLLKAGVDSVAAAFPNESDRLVEEGALYLASGNAADAEAKADVGLTKFGRTPGLLNLKAAALLAKAELQGLAEGGRVQRDGAVQDENPKLTASEETFRKAQKLLQEILDSSPGFAPAWFNMAVLYESRFDDKHAYEAWQKYLEHESDPARRKAVQTHLDQS